MHCKRKRQTVPTHSFRRRHGVGQEERLEEMRWHLWGIVGETFISMVEREEREVFEVKRLGEIQFW